VISDYYNKAGIAAAVEQGGHRNLIGGLWDEVGELQMRFLLANGLEPENTLLDVGCGSLRLGVRAVEFLGPGKYWGTDLNSALLDAGYEKEVVPAGLADKLPRAQLLEDAEFSFNGVPTNIDFAIATSVFTHLPLNHMRLCLANLAQHVATPCTFYFTIFMVPQGASFTKSYTQPKAGVITHPHQDPYHYSIADVRYAAAETPWSIEFIGDWDHPRNQMMVKAHKP
jgi:hypothetical protein